MKIKEGTIRYTMWTVAGNRVLTVHYTIIGDGNGVGNFQIEGEGDPPEIDEDTLRDILEKCFEDSKCQPEIQMNKLADGYDFSKN